MMINQTSRPSLASAKNGRTKEAGFTLVELMVVVAIIAILASIGLPKMTAFIATAETSEAVEQSGRIAKAISGYVDSHPNVTHANIGTTFQPGASGNLGGTGTQITSLIPHLSLQADAKFTYAISVAFTADDNLAVCIKSYKKDADGTAFILYSNLASNQPEWESNVYRAKYIDSTVTVTPGGYCNATGVAQTTTQDTAT